MGSPQPVPHTGWATVQQKCSTGEGWGLLERAEALEREGPAWVSSPVFCPCRALGAWEDDELEEGQEEEEEGPTKLPPRSWVRRPARESLWARKEHSPKLLCPPLSSQFPPLLTACLDTQPGFRGATFSGIASSCPGPPPSQKRASHSGACGKAARASVHLPVRGCCSSLPHLSGSPCSLPGLTLQCPCHSTGFGHSHPSVCSDRSHGGPPLFSLLPCCSGC